MKNIYEDYILVIDFGSQYTKLIARRIRELGIYCEILSWNDSRKITTINPKGVILSGSPNSTNEKHSPNIPNYIFELGVPILGICYGMQIMVKQLGGIIESTKKREFGYAKVMINSNNHILIANIMDNIVDLKQPFINVWMSHNDQVKTLPQGFISIASTKTCPFAIISHEIKKYYGVQFHPEVTHTVQGIEILKRFLIDICMCEILWQPKSIIGNIVDTLKMKIGKDKVILGLSGGLDSFVAAKLLHLAIDKKLICIFIDNGLLRLNEAKKIKKICNEYLNIKIIYVFAGNRFLKALKGISKPELKRKIIGKLFIEIFDEYAKKLNVKWLAQGTIYSDVIESAKNYNKKNLIKSHHNVGGLPKNMKLNLIEPIKNLFKDEVRNIGLNLHLPNDILYRHPFPGPGLGIRVLGIIKKKYCDLLRKADKILLDELKKEKIYNKVSQAFTLFLPIKSVSVMGDKRGYDWIIALRVVETRDFMTAKWMYLSYDFLNHVSNRIINEIHGISRVVYDISNKPPSTIEWE